MVYFKLATCKRGRKCAVCSNQIAPSSQYFLYFQFDKEKMAYPLQENFCLNCAKTVTNPQFFQYLKELLTALSMLREKQRSIESNQNIKTPF